MKNDDGRLYGAFWIVGVEFTFSQKVIWKNEISFYRQIIQKQFQNKHINKSLNLHNKMYLGSFRFPSQIKFRISQSLLQTIFN